MFNDREFLQGAAFFRLISFGEKVTIIQAAQVHSSVYFVTANQTPSVILFKVSTKPTSAWSFTLTPQEVSALDMLTEQYPTFSIFIALVCHKDGVCCLTEKKLQSLMENETDNRYYISVSRSSRGRYHVNGSGKRQLGQSISLSDWPRLLFSNQEK
jgi:hypothetical protein